MYFEFWSDFLLVPKPLKFAIFCCVSIMIKVLSFNEILIFKYAAIENIKQD